MICFYLLLLHLALNVDTGVEELVAFAPAAKRARKTPEEQLHEEHYIPEPHTPEEEYILLLTYDYLFHMCFSFITINKW